MFVQCLRSDFSCFGHYNRSCLLTYRTPRKLPVKVVLLVLKYQFDVFVCDVAYCKNPLNDQWYNFDDHRVSKLHQDAVVTKSAYLLFYRRRLAQTRCAASLQQWVSSACSASYHKRTSDMVHSQSGDIKLLHF